MLYIDFHSLLVFSYSLGTNYQVSTIQLEHKPWTYILLII